MDFSEFINKIVQIHKSIYVVNLHELRHFLCVIFVFPPDFILVNGYNRDFLFKSNCFDKKRLFLRIAISKQNKI